MEDLGPGLWKRKIEKAIPKCRYFVICISQAALKKTGDKTPGFQDDELQQAYEIARVQPEDAFTIVPVRLEDCGFGDHRLSPYQQYDLFKDLETELDRLAVALGGMSLANSAARDSRTKDEKIIEELFGIAETFYYAKDFEKSLSIYGSILALQANLVTAWVNMGVSLSKLDRHDEALASYNKAIEIQPDSLSAMFNKGLALSNLGRYNEAIELFDNILDGQPENADTWFAKGNALKYWGKYDEAIEALEKALKFYKKAKSLNANIVEIFLQILKLEIKEKK
jgi:tetratricopeptide (TPR) repeat protein